MEPLSPRDPRTVGEFELRARLGSGGMGRVYLGYSPAGRAVAIKVVRDDLADDPQFKRRFAREVEAAKAVSGVYTAPVVAAGLDDDPPWFAAAFVRGPSLASVVGKHGPLSEQAVWRLAAGLTEALRAVHACGLVHRDIKPANVLLSADGPHLIDFGISRALDETSLTATGIVVGTPGYMSPEQAESNEAGQPSDVFSLGALLAFAATGKPPFGGGSAASVLYRVVKGQADLDGIGERLRGFISSCLATEPAKRPDLKALAVSVPRADRAEGTTFTSYWPSDVAEIIRTSQPDLAQIEQNGPSRPAQPQGTAQAARPPAAATIEPAAASPAPHVPSSPVPSPYAPPGYQPGPPPGYQPGPPPVYQGARQPRPWKGTPRRGAATLLRIGAALSLANMVVGLADIGALKKSFLSQNSGVSGKTVTEVANSLAGAVIAGDLIGVILWLWLAAAAARGRSWPRPAGTVLFVLYTASRLGTIFGPGFVAGKVLDVAIWLVGLLALIALWRRPSVPRGYC